LAVFEDRNSSLPGMPAVCALRINGVAPGEEALWGVELGDGTLVPGYTLAKRLFKNVLVVDVPVRFGVQFAVLHEFEYTVEVVRLTGITVPATAPPTVAIPRPANATILNFNI